MKTLETVSTYVPRPWCRHVHEQMYRHRFSVVVAHRGAGKSYMTCNALAMAAMNDTTGEGRYLYISPFLKQARDSAWKYLKSATKSIPGVEYQESLLQVRLPNGAWICLYGADNPDALRGMHPHGVVLDEVADMKPEVWGAVVRPMLTNHKAWCLFIGTPHGLNLFSTIYFQALADVTWYAETFDVYKTAVLDEQEIELAKKSMTDRQFAQELLCDFNAGSDKTLIALDVARAASGRHLREDQYAWAPRVLGVDAARYGDDRTAIVRRQGLAMFPPLVRRDLDTNDVISLVIQECELWRPSAVFVDVGGNAGVFDGLVRLQWACFPVDFGGKATDQRYQNKRAEMWCAMRDWLKAGAALPPDPDLLSELCSPEYDYHNVRGRFQLESKDDMRARGLPSPDIADALACTFAFPVNPLQAGLDNQSTGRVLVDE